MFRDPSNLEQILQYFSNVVNKVYAEKESNQSFFDDGMESQAVALSGYSSHLRKASNEEAKDVKNNFYCKEAKLLFHIRFLITGLFNERTSAFAKQNRRIDELQRGYWEHCYKAGGSGKFIRLNSAVR